MEGSDGSPPQSLCMIRAAELFPKPQMEKEDIQLMVPFHELAGESVKYLGRTDDGVLALSNYRIFLLKNSTNSETSVPLGLIEFAQTRDLFHLIINCKDASTVKCSFETAEQCSEWQRRIQLSVGVPESLESLFAFPFCSWTCDNLATNGDPGETEGNGGGVNHSFANGEHLTSLCSVEYSERLQRASRYEDDFIREVERLGFDLHGSWRISHANEDFKLCPSYPQKILVPCCISDETLQTVANFRGSRRLPAVVWRHKKSGAVIARCSQPEVGWLGWRNSRDEQLLKALADACAFDRGEQMRRITETASAFGMTLPSESDSVPSSPDGSHEEVALDEVRKVLIVDARSYTSAVTNRARGGGCECIEYYPCAEIEFMNLGNIHVIRKSFHALRQLCASPPDVPNWLGMLEKTMWLQHLSGLLAASVTVCHAIEKKGRPVLVHCSDGWDRTPQIVATAQLCLDPYYRTVEGFRILVDREWLNYGHKFADRCGHGPGSDEQNERCPVFLQWLDLVHQMHKQFPCSFEFSMGYLIKLAQHSLSCLFGTFFCNTLKERIENSVFERTFSVWPFLSGPMYRNPLYVANREKVLWPAHNLRDLSVWTEVYLGSLGNKNSADFSPCNADGLQGSIPMAKTRSYGDFITSGITLNGISRRSSDPNMTVDPNLTIDSNSENNSVADIQSEREDSPDFIANIIHDTTRKLQNLTTELNNHDENIYTCKELGNKGKSHDLLEYNLENSCIHPADDGEEHYIEKSSSAERKLQHPQEQQQNQTNSSALFNQLEKKRIEPAEIYSSSPPLTTHTIGCEMNSNSLPALSTSISSVLPSPVAVCSEETQNNFNGFLNTLNDIGKSRSNDGRTLFDKFEQRVAGEGGGIVTVHTTNNMNLDLMQSVDLSEHLQENPFRTATSTVVTPNTESVIRNGQSLLRDTENNHGVSWHGSVNTSTDTLVPIESQRVAAQNGERLAVDDEHDEFDGSFECLDKRLPNAYAAKNEARPLNMSYNTTTQATQQENDILPKVHSRPNMLSTSAAATTLQSSTSSSFSFNDLNQFNNINNTNNSSMNKHINNNKTNSKCDVVVSSDDDNVAATTSDLMEESILILPEHQKLEISINGECETLINNIAAGTAATATTREGTSTISGVGLGRAATAITTPTPLSSAAAIFTTTQRRRRTSSSNSRRDCINLAKPTNGSTTSRFAIPGVRSLPLTPPGLPERSQIPISCPDGLAHALSEQNIRLQQIVHEHKMREDLLLREIHDMRMALLKKTCPNCNNATATNDDQCSAIENIENASICSWEAVEDRSGPSSCTSSSLQPTASSVLWVPDHAVSRCTSCHTEFWLGRRKHHCRSCGQIFCADCSEFCAPLPDEKLFSPVRLCGPCYHSVTTRMQQQQQQFQRYKRNSISSSNNNIGNVAGAASNALTLKTLSALALAQKTKAAINTAATNSKEISVQQQTATTAAAAAAASLNGSNTLQTSIATKMMATKAIGVATCCNHAASVATKCQQQQQQQQQRTATMKTAAASN